MAWPNDSGSGQNSNAPAQRIDQSGTQSLAQALTLVNALRDKNQSTQQSNASSLGTGIQQMMGGAPQTPPGQNPFGGSVFQMPPGQAQPPIQGGTSALGGLGSMGDLGELMKQSAARGGQ
jgi:hypothetical protein